MNTLTLRSAILKPQVSDEMVEKYVAGIRAGGPLVKVFPGPMSECAFTERQRELIRQARHELKAARRNGEVRVNFVTQNRTLTKVTLSEQEVPPVEEKRKGLSKLQKMIYLQLGRCFFCGEPLNEEEASIEHLNPRSQGGASTEDNEVVCHVSLNEAFGALDIKRKFSFVLRSAGSFKCPKK